MTSVEYEVICQHLIKINEGLSKIEGRLLTVETCVKTIVEKGVFTGEAAETLKGLKNDLGALRDEVRLMI